MIDVPSRVELSSFIDSNPDRVRARQRPKEERSEVKMQKRNQECANCLGENVREYARCDAV